MENILTVSPSSSMEMALKHSCRVRTAISALFQIESDIKIISVADSVMAACIENRNSWMKKYC